MQVDIELPDELGKLLLEMPDMQLLVQKAVEKMLLEQQKRRATNDLLVEQRELLQQTSNDEILPITRSLVGILKGSHVDVADYKKHLEEKFLPTEEELRIELLRERGLLQFRVGE